MTNPDEVLETVATMIREVIGDESASDVPISFETAFSNDLELESIEFVALAEKLQEHYGPRVGFATWMGGMELEEILSLRVGQLVDFIVRCTLPDSKA